LLEVLPSCVGYLAGVEPITEKVLQAAGRLGIISRNGVGIDNIDLQAAGRLGITVKGTPGANSRGVAELALALMLAGLRSVVWSNALLKEGRWSRRIGSEVEGRTLGIVGCGDIGQRLARMATGIGMKVVGYDPFPNKTLEGMEGFSFVDLDTVFVRSNVISLHCPPTGKPLIDSRSVGLMQKGVVVVNTARDALVDHRAMLDALEQGIVSTYATDVFDAEPPVLDPLLTHGHVVLTPHVGGFTHESVNRATVAAVENIVRFFSPK